MKDIKDFIRERICFYSSMYPNRSSAYEIAALADKLGAAGVELMNFCSELGTPDMKVAREIGSYLRARNLTIPCFSCGINLVGDKARENMEKLFGYAEICAELGIPYLHHTVAPGLALSALDSSIDEIFEKGVMQVLTINEYAARLGVKTVIEDQAFVFNGVENYRRLLDRTEGRIATVLDTGNIFFVNETPENFAKAFKDTIVHVHLKEYKYLPESSSERYDYVNVDGKRFVGCRMGEGPVDFDDISRTLRSVGYKGYYSLEPVVLDTEENFYKEVLFAAEKFLGA